jgi:hypothetical protein
MAVKGKIAGIYLLQVVIITLVLFNRGNALIVELNVRFLA